MEKEQDAPQTKEMREKELGKFTLDLFNLKINNLEIFFYEK